MEQEVALDHSIRLSLRLHSQLRFVRTVQDGLARVPALVLPVLASRGAAT